jgi:hypothetical protein
MANVAVVGYASATSASALAVGSLRPDPSTRADRQPELLLGGAGYRASWSRCGGWAARLPHALSEVDFLPHVRLSSCLFLLVFALTASIVSAQLPAARWAREPEHGRRLAAVPVLQGGANLSAEAESLADFAKVGTPFPPHPFWHLPR